MSSVLARFLGIALGLIVAALILLEASQVLMRYFFALGLPWVRDVSTIGLMWMAWLGAPLLWIRGNHIAVDFLPLPQGDKWRLFGLFVMNLSMAVAALVLIYYVSRNIESYAAITLNGIAGVSASVKYYPHAVGAALLFVSSLLVIAEGRTDDD